MLSSRAPCYMKHIQAQSHRVTSPHDVVMQKETYTNARPTVTKDNHFYELCVHASVQVVLWYMRETESKDLVQWVSMRIKAFI